MMNKLAPLLSLVVFAGVGCTNGPIFAPPGATVQPPEPPPIAWRNCLLDPLTGGVVALGCENPDPMLISMTSVALDGTTQLPLNNVRMSYTSGYSGIYLLPQEVVEAVEIPDTPNWQRLAGDGRLFAEFTYRFEGDYRPTYFETGTNRVGAGRVWVFINEMPFDPGTGQAAGTSIVVDIYTESALIQLQPL